MEEGVRGVWDLGGWGEDVGSYGYGHDGCKRMWCCRVELETE